ncbi:hypothetical protein GW17_00039282, partial [Ensete ventricosum]
AWTWFVRPRKASTVMTNRAGLDAGEGNLRSVIILQKWFGVGPAVVKATRRPYLRSLLRMLLTMPSYFIAASVVLAARRATCFLPLGSVGLALLTPVRSAVR